MLIPLGKWILPVSSERGSGAIFFGGIARIVVMTTTASAAATVAASAAGHGCLLSLW